MLGIPDPGVWIVMILCVLSSALCIVYGVMNWNADDDAPVTDPHEREWAEEEKKIEEEL